MSEWEPNASQENEESTAQPSVEAGSTATHSLHGQALPSGTATKDVLQGAVLEPTIEVRKAPEFRTSTTRRQFIEENRRPRESFGEYGSSIAKSMRPSIEQQGRRPSFCPTDLP